MTLAVQALSPFSRSMSFAWDEEEPLEREGAPLEERLDEVGGRPVLLGLAPVGHVAGEADSPSAAAPFSRFEVR